MGSGVSLLLAAVGAILTFAVRVTGSGSNIHTIGIILLAVGAVGAFLFMMFWSSWRAHGYAPQEVRVPCRSHGDAKELALRLRADGYGVIRRWSYVIAGTDTREQADRLTKSLYDQVGSGSERAVWSPDVQIELAA